jgi:hypothetical protein
VRLPTDVPELKQDLGAFRMHRVYDFPPACHLCVGKDARRSLPTVSGWSDEGCLCNHQTAPGRALSVILCHKIAGHIAWQVRTHPCHWRKDQTMRKIHRTDPDWRKQL